ncbi:hypothetical protein BGZ46_002213 [Entomortierella lignicola]|nr:hypothetical protein BGZ46_002213 [Entomortierella lignicola]
MDGNSSVEITLSNDSTLKRTPGPNSQASNVHHCDTILGNMLHDSSTYDVFFEFEPPEGETIYDCEPVAGDEKGFVEVKKEEADESVKDEKDKDEKDKDENDKGKESALSSISDDKKNAGGQDAAAIWDKVGAHKIVLSQFEYFKTMFSSSFAEGGPGVKTIKIKDTDVQCFRILIEYLYLGRLGLFSTPRTLTEDEANDTSPTWEDVYLIADRYNVVDLRRMAASRILLGLNTKWAVAFLFRTAYLFDDLRTPVITYIVQKSMPQIVTKDALEKYYDHPECGSIMVELLAALWKVKTVQATSFFTVGSPTSASSTKKE